jgi:VIT1/CCC1 family predicted Fe2+/Mn2+ transporter
MNGFWRKTVSGSIREIVFGLEDSLVSTLGALTGIAAGTQSTFIVVLSGLVLIAVEATSMSAGSYLSSKSASDRRPLRAAGVMGLFYLVGGCIPLLPYFLFPIHSAFLPSIFLTAVVLFLVGIWSAGLKGRSRLRGGVEMVTVSLGAALMGYLIGRAASLYIPMDFQR